VKKLTKQLLVKMINEYVHRDSQDSNQGFAKHGEYEVDNSLIMYEESTERIVSLIKEFTHMVDQGTKSGDLTNEQLGKVIDFQLTRIQRSLDYANSTLDSITKDDDLDMTTPEV